MFFREYLSVFCIFFTSVLCAQNYFHQYGYNYQQPEFFPDLYTQQLSGSHFHNYQPDLSTLQHHLTADVVQVPAFLDNLPLTSEGINLNTRVLNVPNLLMNLQPHQDELSLQSVKPIVNLPTVTSKIEPAMHLQVVSSPVQPGVSHQQLVPTNTLIQPLQTVIPTLSQSDYSQIQNIPHEQNSLDRKVLFNPDSTIKTNVASIPSDIQMQVQTKPQLNSNVFAGENKFMINPDRSLMYTQPQNILQHPFPNPYMSVNMPYPTQFPYAHSFPFQQYPQNSWPFQQYHYPQMNTPFSPMNSMPYMNIPRINPYVSQYRPSLEQLPNPEIIYEEYDENNNLLSSSNGTYSNFTQLLATNPNERKQEVGVYNTYQYPINATYSEQSSSNPKEIKKFTNSVKNSTVTIVSHTLLKPNKKPEIILQIYKDPLSGGKNETIVNPEKNVFNIETNVENVENIGPDSVEKVENVEPDSTEKVENIEPDSTEKVENIISNSIEIEDKVEVEETDDEESIATEKIPEITKTSNEKSDSNEDDYDDEEDGNNSDELETEKKVETTTVKSNFFRFFKK